MKEDKVLNMVAAEKEATIRAIQAKIKARQNRTLKDVKITETTSPLAIDPTVHTEATVIEPSKSEDWVDVKDKG